MKNYLIKICGIRDVEMADAAAQLGAHLIGLVFHPHSSRAVTLEQAVCIVRVIKKARALPVAVFVDQSVREMQHICEVTDIQVVQLHGQLVRATHHLLPKQYQRIYVKNEPILTNKEQQYLDKTRDMILLDHPEPGQGKKIAGDFIPDFKFPWLLAGGLKASNVNAMLKQYRPDGVDVSSGVEVARGQKEIFLIQQFVNAVKGHYAS